MYETIFKLDFMFGYRNMIIKLYITICNANNESEINVVRRINACTKFLLALTFVHSTIFDTFLTILVLVPVDAGFLGGWIPFHLLGQP